MRVAIIGAGGQLGTDLMSIFEDWDVLPLNHAEFEVCDYVQVRNTLESLSPEVVINTAAYHRVDDCEEDPIPAFEVNVYAVRNLAMVCEQIECQLVHLSTDYVFGGGSDKPYKEDDIPNPLNVYGVSKLAGEYFVRHLCTKHVVVRSSGLYGVAGASGKGGNFVETMLRLANQGKPIRVVSDQVLTPTFTLDLARTIREILEHEGVGLFHVTNTDACSWYAFARAIFELTDLHPDLSETTSAAYGARATRPQYSVLAHERLVDLGLAELRSWREALEEYLSIKGHLHGEGDG